MNFLKKRSRSANGTANGTVNGTANGTANARRTQEAPQEPNDEEHGTREPRPLNNRPSFGQWLKEIWLDIVTLIATQLLTLLIYYLPPAASRTFPVLTRIGDVADPTIAYERRPYILDSDVDSVIALLVPLTVFTLMQIRIRSFWDFNNAVYGLIYSVSTGSLCHGIISKLIGGLRPNFLDIYQPRIDGSTGLGFDGIMYDRSICTGDEKEINHALQSFPSGHTTAAFGGFVFLYLYLNAKLKVWSNYRPAHWKLLATYAPIVGAILMGGALTIDHWHHWYDIVAGAVLGTTMAFSAYRMMYASVWDFRFNHIPLLRHTSFTYTHEAVVSSGFGDALWTRKAGWGARAPGPLSGAPFDAAGTTEANNQHESSDDSARPTPVPENAERDV